ncbi:hypothetical protein FSP39_006732, partial [Pinctada imbricata]
ILHLLFDLYSHEHRGRGIISFMYLSDLLVGLLYVSSNLAETVNLEWQAGNAMCKVTKYLHAVAAYGSTNALVALSIDRLISVARPLKAIGKGRRTKILIALSWVFAMVFSLPMFLFHTIDYQGKTFCSMNLSAPWMWKVYILLITFAVFIVPAVIIALCYIIIVVIIWKKSSFNISSRESANEHTRIISRDSNSECSTPMKFLSKKQVHWSESGSSSRGLIPKAKIKTVKMTFVIVLAFILCWSPYFLYNLLHVFGHIPQTQRSKSITVFIQSLAPLNSAANPFIYLLFNSQTYKKFCNRKRRNNCPSSSTQMTHV